MTAHSERREKRVIKLNTDKTAVLLRRAANEWVTAGAEDEQRTLKASPHKVAKANLKLLKAAVTFGEAVLAAEKPFTVVEALAALRTNSKATGIRLDDSPNHQATLFWKEGKLMVRFTYAPPQEMAAGALACILDMGATLVDDYGNTIDNR